MMQGLGGYGMMGGFGRGMGIGALSGAPTWMGIVGMALHALLWIAAIVLVVYFVKRWSGRMNIRRAGNALDILNDRFVKGELTADQYKQMKKDLLS